MNDGILMSFQYTIILFLISVILSMVSWFLIFLFKKNNTLDSDLQKTKINYIDRFNNVNNKLETIHIDIALIKEKLNANQTNSDFSRNI